MRLTVIKRRMARFYHSRDAPGGQPAFLFFHQQSKSKY